MSIPTIADPSFEQFQQSANQTYNPTGTAWTFTPGAGGNSGIARSQGDYSPNLNCPDGSQCGFLEKGSAISQAPTDWVSGTYKITCQAIQSPFEYYQGNPTQILNVLVDGAVIDTFTPAPSSGGYESYISPAFTISTPGSHSIAFQGSGSGNSLALIDEIGVAAVPGSTPAPATLKMLAPTSAIEGQSATGFVALVNGPALSADLIVNLTASGATVPSSVTIPAGQTTVSFAVTPSALSFQVTASATGYTSATASGSATLPSTTFPPTSLVLGLPLGTVGQAGQGSASLVGGIAPAAATTVALSGTGCTVPAAVTIAANASSTMFSVTPTAASYAVSATTSNPGTSQVYTASASSTASVVLPPIIPASVSAGTLTTGTPTASTVPLTLAGTTGGTSPYVVQFQQASASTGPWTNIGLASSAMSTTAPNLNASTAYFFRAIVTDSSAPTPLAATTATVSATTIASVNSSIVSPTLGLVTYDQYFDGSDRITVSSCKRGTNPVSFYELFIVSATFPGDPTVPVKTARAVGSVSFNFPPGGHTYVVRAVDSGTPPTFSAPSSPLTGAPALQPLPATR